MARTEDAKDPGPAALLVRDARPDELRAVMDLVLSAYEVFLGSLSQEFAAGFQESLKEVLLHDETEVLVAERSERIVGTVTLYPAGAHYGGEALPSDWAAMRLLAVSPAYRRQGVGRALTQECFRRVSEHHVSTVLLHTLPSMTEARAMYEDLGFRRVPDLDAALTPEVTVLAYRLDLGEA
jgi:ribosomal protein S18 acetylase RimI-like enzyme